MRHAPSRLPALAVAGVLAGALIVPSASAQTASGQGAPPSTGEVAGLRYLSWPGKAVRQAPARVAAAASSAPPRAFAPPSVVEPVTRADASPRPGLTPASAFYTPGASIGGRFAAEPSPSPDAAPVPAPQAAPAPEADTHPAPEPRMRRLAASPRAEAPSPVSAPVPHAPLPSAPPPSAPPPEPAPAPAPAPAPSSLAEAAPAAAADPMAPRRDAPIFRLQRQAAPEPTPAGEAASQSAQPAAEPAASGARYYSVHRQHGQRPDAIAAPEPAWLDAMPVQLATAPADTATDLAAPPAAPALRRDASGKLQPAAPLVSGDPS